MDRDRQKEIARKGGKAAHQKGTAHEFTADEARAAGRKGGETVSANRGHMSQIGRIGGKKSAGRKKPVSGNPDHPNQPVQHAEPHAEAQSVENASLAEDQPAEDAA